MLLDVTTEFTMKDVIYITSLFTITGKCCKINLHINCNSLNSWSCAAHFVETVVMVEPNYAHFS